MQDERTRVERVWFRLRSPAERINFASKCHNPKTLFLPNPYDHVIYQFLAPSKKNGRTVRYEATAQAILA